MLSGLHSDPWGSPSSPGTRGLKEPLSLNVNPCGGCLTAKVGKMSFLNQIPKRYDALSLSPPPLSPIDLEKKLCGSLVCKQSS